MSRKNENGFSLVEIILYLGIFALFFVFLLAIFQDSIFIKSKISQKIDNIENGQYALNKIVWYLQNAQSINEPKTGQESNILSLNLADSQQNPVVFSLENNKLKIKIGANSSADLTNDRIKVNNLSFTNNGFLGEPAIINIKLQLENFNNFWKILPVTLQISVKTEK